ncbi:hypothetical protein ACFQ1Q_01110 [Winogradskyella litorisediminis]|uniref:DUF4382 domain-containing protein n=1 Tax=Winogradskyella litorisediminis TaxID=1156618 RepID=A0ABW3N6G1_9FLAO
MKNFKIAFLMLFSVTLFNCDSDDDNNTNTDVPAVSFDVTSVIALAPNSDITNLVTFNGQNAALYTTELSVGSTLRVGRPEGLGTNDIFTYDEVIVSFEDNGEIIEINFDENTFISSDGFLQYIIPAGQPSNYFDLDEITVFEIQAIDANATVDIDYKYEMSVFIERDNITYGPYFIDPKIRVKSLN